MSAPPAISEAQNYPRQLLALIGRSASQLVRRPAALHRPEAIRRLRMQSLWLIGIGTVLIAVLMFGFDATEIAMMPPRGAPSAWPARAITDFGKDSYVLTSLGAALIVMALAFPLLHGAARGRLLRFAGHVEYLFFAVALPVAFAAGPLSAARPIRSTSSRSMAPSLISASRRRIRSRHLRSPLASPRSGRRRASPPSSTHWRLQQAGS
jgi:hypothetical protein